MTLLEYYIEQVKQFISALTDDIKSGYGTIVTQTKLAVYREVLKHLEEIEQDPCDDAISREAVLNKIKEVCFSEEWLQFRVNKGSNGQRNFIINYIDQLQPVNATKTGNWIPVSERLPDDPLDTNEYVEYLVIDAKGQCGVGFYHYDAKAWDSVNWGWLEREDKVDNHEAFIFTEPSGIGKVVAWMPLPKPYKAESEKRNERMDKV